MKAPTRGPTKFPHNDESFIDTYSQSTGGNAGAFFFIALSCSGLRGCHWFLLSADGLMARRRKPADWANI